MRSKELDLTKYHTDKIDSEYLRKYDPIFGPLAGKKIDLLELGVFGGGSMLLWKDYFPEGSITGVDISLPANWQPTDRVRLFEGSQGDTAFLSKVANEVAPAGFDIIIDDASHFGGLTKTAFWHLFDHHLKPGGIYVIEDWGTGYWEDWPDGRALDLASYAVEPPAQNTLLMKIKRRLGLNTKSPMPGHSYGMVGLIKQLVDEQAAADVTRSAYNVTSKRKSKFEQMLITEAIVFITKVGKAI
jgi:SAM-dependent methyltransferase